METDLDAISGDMWEPMLQLSLLDPPEEAETFHRLAYEMMQLRLNGVEVLTTAYVMLMVTLNNPSSGTSLESSERSLQNAQELMDQSDQLWLDVLSEGRKLGRFDVTVR